MTSVLVWPWRCPSGFNAIMMKAPPARLPPVKPTTLCTAWSFLMMPTTCWSLFCIDWKDTLSSARTPA